MAFRRRSTDITDLHVSQLSYMFPQYNVAGSAPYGNDKSKKMQVKLIAGKPELVPDEHKISPRQAPPTPVRLKKSVKREFNVHNINTYPESLYIKDKSQELQSQEAYNHNTARRTLSPHKVIPPIKQQQPENPETALINKLEHACNGSYIPARPILYTRDEELVLKKLIQKYFIGLTLDKCKNVYNELTRYGVNQSGLVTFTEMVNVLTQFEIFVNEDVLRLVAAQFVGDGIDGHKINCEKVLAYIRGGLKELEAYNQYEPTARSHHDGVYRNPITNEMEDYGPKSKKYPYGEREFAKLRQTVNTQLEAAEETGMKDFEEIWSMFRKEDRQHRGMMSREQIHGLTEMCKIPLQHILIDQIIDKACHGSHGQYDWQQYLEFIEKVYPVKTGLHLPPSKKPTEYAKELPEPSNNWPHGSNRNNNGNDFRGLPSKYTSPRKAATDYTNPYDDTDRRSPAQVRRSPDWTTRDTDYRKNYGDPHERSQSKQSEIESINDELRRLEEKFTNEKSKLQTKKQQIAVDEYSGNEPWFNRFLKLTDALYKADKNYRGLLARDEARWIVNRYNEAFYLGLRENVIEDALSHSRENDHEIVIDHLAKWLSEKDDKS